MLAGSQLWIGDYTTMFSWGVLDTVVYCFGGEAAGLRIPGSNNDTMSNVPIWQGQWQKDTGSSSKFVLLGPTRSNVWYLIHIHEQETTQLAACSICIFIWALSQSDLNWPTTQYWDDSARLAMAILSTWCIMNTFWNSSLGVTFNNFLVPRLPQILLTSRAEEERWLILAPQAIWSDTTHFRPQKPRFNLQKMTCTQMRNQIYFAWPIIQAWMSPSH